MKYLLAILLTGCAAMDAALVCIDQLRSEK